MRLLAFSRPMTGSGSISGIANVAIGVAGDDEGVGPRDQALAVAEAGSLVAALAAIIGLLTGPVEAAAA